MQSMNGRMETKMSDKAKKGTLYGVSTGPGDPELMTIKAAKCIKNCHVIAAPRTRGKNSMALDIVNEIMEEDLKDKEICYLDFTMSKDRKVLHKAHEQQAKLIEKYLETGEDVAMLNIGDTSLYSTFSYIRDIVQQDGYEVQAIAGVTSFCAVAAELGQSLTTMKKPLTIIPGWTDENLKLLELPGTKVIMKSGKSLLDVREVLGQKNLLDKAAMVENCGLKEQRVYRNIEQCSGDEGYFSTILVKD